jgi:hypothetical protein
MSARRGSRSLLLLALCAALGAILYEEIERPLRSEIVVSGGAPASLAPLPAEPQFTMPPESSFAAVLERPVFSPTRRPMQAGDAKASSTATSVDFTLIGVVITGGERYAIVKPSNGDAFQRLNEGDELAGWSAVSIRSDRVLLRRGTLEKEVVLDYKTPVPPGSLHPKRKLANAPAQPGQPPAQPADGQPQPAPDGGANAPPPAPGQ